MTDAQDDRLSREEFARLLERERPTLRVIAAGEVGLSDAEDVVQDAAINAMKKLDAFAPGTNFLAWMATFVRMTASNHKRATVRRTKRRLRLAGEASAHADVPGELERLDDRILDAIDGLSAEQRVCLLLRVAMSHTYEQIGVALGMPSATVRSHVRRARLRLIELLPAEEVLHG